jgi:hypothetical protein
LYNNVVPISLYVSMEIVKVVVNYLVEQASRGHDRTGTSENVTRHASYVLHTICRQCRPSRWGALSNYSQCE